MSAQDVPALVGRSEAAEILGVTPNHTHKMQAAGVLPPPLQDRDARHEVGRIPLWTREEIEAIARARAS